MISRRKDSTVQCFCLLIILVALPMPAFASKCDQLLSLNLSHTEITTAELVFSGTLKPGGESPISGLPTFCRVVASLHPVQDSDIRVEMWMPESGWNGRLEGTGNGGLAGRINYGLLKDGVRNGYAVVNTDMGLAVPPGKDAGVFVERPERWADWGYRATHEMTLLAKQLVKAYYGRDAKKSYFTGCSTGGEQALMEAQRFPDDYDGIVGGAPAHNRTGVHVSILWNFAVPQRSAGSYLPPVKISLLSDAVVHFCDALDGVMDGLITDPRVCRFDPASLQCKASDGEKCLTAEQVATVRALYAGPTDPKSGKQLYPGLQMGSEFGWAQLSPAPNPSARAPYSPVFEWVFGEKWDWRAFDFDQDVDRLNDRLAETLNATNPDLDTFRSHGHKLLLYHGWGDSLVAPGETINYYEAVRTRDAELNPHRDSSEAGGSIDASVRLFMVPGMGHCGGGPGAASFDPLNAMVKWVEDGTAPDVLIAAKSISASKSGSITQQRLLCPYPQVARYWGAGNADDASAYVCALPNSATDSRNFKK